MVHHVISFPRGIIYLDVHALGQCLLWPEGHTYFLQESFSPHPLLTGESLKILRVAKGSNFINFIHAEAHHHLLDVGNTMFPFFCIFVFFCRFLSFFFGSVYHMALRLESCLRSQRESLFGPRGTSTCHVHGLLAIEALPFAPPQVKNVPSLASQVLSSGMSFLK